jgi:hypothetical protein
MSIPFDGFTPTLIVGSSSTVDMTGYNSLEIQNGADVVLDTTKLTTTTLPAQGTFGYVIANFSGPLQVSLSLSNGGKVGGYAKYKFASFGTQNWASRFYFDGTDLILV